MMHALSVIDSVTERLFIESSMEKKGKDPVASLALLLVQEKKPYMYANNEFFILTPNFIIVVTVTSIPNSPYRLQIRKKTSARVLFETPEQVITYIIKISHSINQPSPQHVLPQHGGAAVLRHDSAKTHKIEAQDPDRRTS